MYDEPFDSNKQWAAIGELSNQEMNALELELLFAVKFSLVISREEYDQCHEALLQIDQAYHPRIRQCKTPISVSPPVMVPRVARCTSNPSTPSLRRHEMGVA